MNSLRRAIHFIMESTGLDRRVEACEVNAYLERRRAAHFPVIPGEAANLWILEAIRTGKPAAIGKLGSSECWALAWHLRLKRFYKYTWQPPSFGELDLADQSGVFPKDESTFHRFCEIYLERLGLFDGLAVWHNPGEAEVISRYCPQARRLELRSLEPYFFDPPWSSALEGKRVLIVHPFEDTICRQFARRAELWPDQRSVLPLFELDVVKSPYGFSKTDFADWTAMNRWLENEVERSFREKRFDVALIGCGAAGLPLVAFVKQLGAIGIHTGGATQLLFGIRGGRWDSRVEFQRFFNKAWVRPQAEETPEEAKKVDSFGYW